MSGALDRELWVTTFPDVGGLYKHSYLLSLNALRPLLLETTAPDKASLPLLKLAKFGERRSSKGSARHDRNVQECDGLEVDYDGEKVTPEAHADALRQHNLAGLVVTSPSHRDAAPRARILVPFSRPLKPAERERMVSRLAGILPGELAPESWTLSQAYYFGRVGDAPQHRVLEVEGDYIDLRPDLEATARTKPARPAKARTKTTRDRKRLAPVLDNAAEPASGIPAEALALDIRAALIAISMGQGGHDALVSVSGLLAAQDVPQDMAVALLTFAADQRPPDLRDDGWKRLRADIRRTVSWAAEREAEAHTTPQAAAGQRGNGAAPPPPGTGAPPASPQPQPLGGGAAATRSGRAKMRNRNPKYAGNLANVITVLLDDPALAGCVAFDQMANGISLRRALPGDAPLTDPRPWNDADTSRLQDYLQRVADMTRVSRDTVQQGADRVARDFPFHPVQDYLNSLGWDGTPRLDAWLTTYLGVAPSDYAARSGRWWLIGMVARIMRPGCKFDYMLILEGLQGTLKSQVCVALCGPWVSDQSLDIRHDACAASQHLRNKWLIEVSELAFFRQADVETLKAFISRTHERYLPRYARNEVVEPRQCGFLGTTNSEAYLHDPTGGRRFWPHRAGTIAILRLMRDRDHLWAEAVAAYQAGEEWWPDPDFEAAVIRPEQEARYDADGWTPLVADYVANKSQVTLIDVFRRALADPHDPNRPELPPDEFDRRVQIRVREILQNLGWKRGPTTKDARWWEKPPCGKSMTYW